MGILTSIIAWLYYVLIFLVPLTLYPHTSEIFEFNKIIVTYLFTIAITATWVVKMIYSRNYIFKRTKLDIPILIFLGTLILSTLFSIDPHTSIYGYYTRFHGGLLSYITYALLYWAFVSNLKRHHAVRFLHSFIASSLFVSTYAILQHFGIDKDIWVQDVQLRVFSTLGQPNWLAAWIVGLLPISWVFLHNLRKWKEIDINEVLFGSYWLSAAVFFIYYLVLSYTRSRSGFIALFAAGIVYAVFVLRYKEIDFAQLTKSIVGPIALVVVYAILAGTPFTPSLIDSLRTEQERQVQQPTPSTQPSEQEEQPQQVVRPDISFSSREIRMIVWTGALDVWKDNPIVGTGPETFAYSYYNHRPVEHNLVSEWDFLYNKAHNEYLNQLATTGIVGTLGYLIFHLGVMWLLFKNFLKDESDSKFIHVAFLAGFVSIIITNFIGFSVVPVGLQMFLFPAISAAFLSHHAEEEDDDEGKVLESTQKTFIAIVILVAIFFMYRAVNYWRADMRYARGQRLNDAQNYQEANKVLTEAIEIRENESVYWQELSESQMGLALILSDVDPELSAQMARRSYENSEKAESMNPYDVNNIRKQASVFIKLSYIDENYLPIVEQTIIRAVELAPTEAKLIYNLGAIQLQLGKIEQAINTLEHAVEIRPVYADARYALALGYIETDQIDAAREQLNYILNNIDPNYSRAKEELQNLDNE